MLIDYVKKELSGKWGAWYKEKSYEYIGTPEYMIRGMHFAYVFLSLETDKISDYAENIGFCLPREMKIIYSMCNGMRLFLSSFSLYGFQSGKDEMEPYDIRTENYNIHARMRENGSDRPECFFFGSFGDYVFAYNKKEIKCFKNGFSEEVLTFSSIDELLHFFIPRIMDKYDKQFYKKNPNAKFKQIPTLANAMFDISEITDN